VAALTISENDGLAVYTVGGTPSTGPFAVDFPYFSASEITVTKTVSGVDTVLVNGTDYTLTGVAADDGYSSGSVALAVAVSSCTITVERTLATTKSVNFSVTGLLQIATLNTFFSRLFSWQQDLKRKFGLALRVPTSEYGNGVSLTAGLVSARKGKVLAWHPTTGALTASTATLEELEGGVVDFHSVETLADLTALTSVHANVLTACRTTIGDGGGGEWYWDSSNCSALVSADARKGLTAAPDSDPTGASGAYRRRYSGLANALWFGVVGDGASGSPTDNHAAFQAAVDVARSVYVPYGDYLVSDIIELKYSYSALVGDYRLPVIRIAAANGPAAGIVAIDAALNEFSRIENILFYCIGKPPFSTTPGPTNCAVLVDGSGSTTAAAVQRSLVKNCRFLGFSLGVYHKYTVNAVFERLLMEQHTDWSAESGYTSANYYMMIYHDCTAYPGPVGISPCASTEVVNCLIGLNYVPANVTRIAFKAYGDDCRDIFWSRCESAGGDYGYWIESTGTNLNIDFHIDRPIIDAANKIGIYVKDFRGTGTLTIDNGYIVKTGNVNGAGIWLDNCDGIAVTGGVQIIGVGLDTAYDEGVRILNSSGCSVSGLLINNCRIGISLDNADNCTVTGNTIYSDVNSTFEATPTLEHGIRLFSSSTNNSITGNSIKGASASYKLTYGIYVEAGSSKNVITGNSIDSTTVTNPYVMLESDNIVLGYGQPLAATFGGTGLSSLGTGVATALGINVGSAGAFVVLNGALGTPSSATLTNATGLPISTGVSGLASGVATFLSTPSSANLASALTDEVGAGKVPFGLGDAWTAYTPTIAALAGSITTLGTVSGRYLQVGKLLHVSVNVAITNIGTASGGLSITLPSGLTCNGAQVLAGRENTLTGAICYGTVVDGGGVILAFNSAGAFPVASGGSIVLSGVLEVN
jgi:parallel beta-helix repeat protein